MPLTTLSIAHVNLNCRSLETSRPFFEALGLVPAIRTDPEPQDCRAFGFDGDARWDAWMMQDGRGLGSAALDLLEWKEPAPVGRPAVPGTAPGLERLGFTVVDLEAARSAVVSRGGQASAIAELPLGIAAGRRGFGATTPDGQALLVSAADGDRLAHVGISCLDLARSADFYERVFGLERRGTVDPVDLPGTVFQPSVESPPRAVRCSAQILYPAGGAPEPGATDPFRVVLTEWECPRASGCGAEQPNRVGLFRMAFLVEDIDRCHEELVAFGVDGLSTVVALDLGPSCPSPPCRALFFRDPDGACLELIEVPRF